MNPVIIIIASFLFLTLGVGLFPVFGTKVKEKLTVDEYFLGKRGLGTVLIFFTTMATWYSSSLFLGAVAEVYTKGLEWVFGFSSSTLSGLVFYFLGPKINEISAKKRHVTQGDFFEDRFKSEALGFIVGLIGIIFMVPYLVIQLTGTGIIFNIFTDGQISYELGAFIGLGICMIFIFFGGMRSVAWTDFLFGVVFLTSIWGVVLLIMKESSGGFIETFKLAAEKTPELLTLPGPTGVSWQYFLSQIWVIGLGGYMWPHLFLRIYAANSAKSVRKVGAMVIFAALFAQVPVIFGALAAAIAMPGLEAPDTALLLMTKKYAPMWVIGVLGAGGIAASLSTVNSLVHAEGVLISKDFYSKITKTEPDSKKVLTFSRICIVLICGFVYLAALTKPQFLWTILSQAYSGVTQLFPLTIAALFWKKATKEGAITAISGGLTVAILFSVGPQVLRAPLGIVGPFWGMMVNTVLLVVVSLMTQKEKTEQHYLDFQA